MSARAALPFSLTDPRTDPQLDGLAQLDERGWRGVLDYSDRARLTLVLRDAAGDAMPQWVRDRVDGNAAKNWLIRPTGIEDAVPRRCTDWLGGGRDRVRGPQGP